MRYTGTRGYSGYRGRRPGGKRWLVVLLTLILLAAAAFLVIQRYIVYDKDGSYHFEFPWQRTASMQKPTLRGARQDLEIIIEQPDAPAALPLHVRELNAAAWGDMPAALAALPDSVNAVAVRLKTADGVLLYPSTLSDAVEAQAVAGGAEAGDALRVLTDSGYYTVARLAALHDSRFSHANVEEAAIQQKQYRDRIWFAPDSSFYLAAEKELARQYLCSIAREVAALGFDELLFDEFGYPTAGRLDNIKTEDRELTMPEALSLLADNLRETLSDTDVKLSVVMDEKTVLDGANAKSGQELARLAIRFDRIYVPTSEANIPALLEALAPYTAELVPILSAPAADDGAYLIGAE